jgi:alanine racemase
MFVLHLLINNLIKKSSFYLLEKKYLETTLNKEKELINLITSKNNILKLLNIHSKFDKDMHSAGLLNVNKSDIVINMFKDLCSV